MPYCPIKSLVSRFQSSPYIYKKSGVYDAKDECDKDQCGFWSHKHEECGIAAIASNVKNKSENNGSAINGASEKISCI